MAITINVNGVNSGGGNNNQPPTPPTPQPPIPQPPTPPIPQPPTPPTPPTPQPPQPIRYQRPDFSQYAPSGNQTNNPLPTSDRMVNDIRAEISRRGVILVPGTQNFSVMLNTMQQNLRTNVMGAVNNQYDNRVADIDKRDAALYNEIKARLDVSRNSELAGTTDPIAIKDINDRYDRLEQRESRKAGQFFAGEYNAAAAERDSQTAEAEQRLTEALQRLTEELSQGNKDSYLNNLRDKYKEQIWRRDNADSEAEAREASREAAKIQERMQRAMSPTNLTMQRWLGTVGTVATTAINTGVQLDRLGIQQDYVGFDMASSVLNGNAFAAIRQENALKEQKNSAIYGGLGAGGGALIGAAIGSAFGGVGSIPGYAIGGLVGMLMGSGVGTLGGHLANRGLLIEDERTRVADLWRQEESRIMKFNDLAMLTRGTNRNIGEVRQRFVDASGEREFVKPELNNDEGFWDGLADKAKSLFGLNKDNKSSSEQKESPSNNLPDSVWKRSESRLDLYDLGYTAPEFAQQIARRIKQRGFVGEDYEKNALYSDALERVFSMNSGALGQLSAYDRFGKNNAIQDFADLAYTLDGLKTTGMRNGQWARSDEFARYMTQLQQGQRSTFLTVDNARVGRQIATGQAIFGDKFGAEALQGIQQVNNTIQNPKGGFAQTLLYDVIQELYPDTRGRIDLIEQAQYDPVKQNAIQREYQRRIQSIYGGVDTTAGYLAAQEIWGIQNPNVMMPIVKQLGRNGEKGGLEAQRLKSANLDSIAGILNNDYTPQTTQRINAVADQQMKSLLGYQEQISTVVQNILDKIETSIGEKLQEAVDNLK